MYAIDHEFDHLLLKVMHLSRNTEHGRCMLPKIFESLTKLYRKTDKFSHFFYPEIVRDFLNNELNNYGAKVDTKKAIASALSSIIASNFENEEVSLDLFLKYKMLIEK